MSPHQNLNTTIIPTEEIVLTVHLRHSDDQVSFLLEALHLDMEMVKIWAKAKSWVERQPLVETGTPHCFKLLE